jgi:hypothetical protein
MIGIQSRFGLKRLKPSSKVCNLAPMGMDDGETIVGDGGAVRCE